MGYETCLPPQSPLIPALSGRHQADSGKKVLLSAEFRNPYYSLKEIRNRLKERHEEYDSFWKSDDFLDMSLWGRYDYAMPYYNINGDIDYQTNYSLACEYFEQVNAPRKQMFVMKDATHGLLESRSEEFSGFLHRIAGLYGESANN